MTMLSQKIILASAALMVLASVGVTAARAAEAALAPDPAPLIAEDDWVHKPTAKEAWSFYPERATRQMRSGEVRLRCAVEDTGQVTGCVVVADSKPGNRFGEAALKMSRLFVIRPRVINGAVVDGALVTIPIVFRVAQVSIWPQS
jgi:protein TonB